MEVFFSFYGYKLQNLTHQIMFLRASDTILPEHMKELW